ncbi:MAG TPA: hypothetical protein VKU41_12830 [Polyangiaceae bacterium]|nr:hypothetical protein [Polyangiaceae bacterium]
MNYNPYAPPQASPSPQGPLPNGQPQPWSTGEVFPLAWARFKEAWPALVLSYFIATFATNVVSQAPNLIVLIAGLDPRSGAGLAVRGASLLVALPLSVFLQVGLTRIWLATARGEAPRVEQLFSGADRLLPMLGYLVLFGLAVCLGLVFFIVPGVILAVGLGFGQYYVVDTNLGPVDALKASWEATRGQRGEIFLLGMAVVGVNLLGLLTCCVGLLASAPIGFVAVAIAYTRLSGNRPAAAAPPAWQGG